MIILNKGMQKVIASGIALLLTLTVLFITAFAILSTEKVGLSVNVSYDPLVTAKVYLATNSSTAGTYEQPNSTVTTENFVKANSALILDTKDGGTLQKATFEALGSGTDNGLKCDANGEMEFYVYVENYSTTESVYSRANINFTDNEIAPFSIETNPDYEIAGTAENVGSPSASLLTFKIKSANEAGLNTNTIQIQIDLFDSIFSALNIDGGKYTSGSYSGMYYIEMGNAPQSYAGTASTINATQQATQWIDNNYYYRDINNPNIQYVFKDSKYYKVEPIRWIIIADENYTTDGGTLGIDYFSNTNLATIDRTLLNNISLNQIVVVSEKLITNFSFDCNYTNCESQMRSLRNKVFTEDEQNLLKPVSLTTFRDAFTTLDENFSLMAGYETTENFYVSNYLATPALRQASNTAYLANATTNPSGYNVWSLRSWYGSSTHTCGYYIDSSGIITCPVIPNTNFPPRGIRPFFVFNLGI